MEPHEEEKKNVNSAFELGMKLYKEEYEKERTTQLVFTDVALLDMFMSHGERIEQYRVKYLHLNVNSADYIKNFMLITGERNLRFRMSIDGWRAEQTVRAIQAPPISTSMQPDQNQDPNLPGQFRRPKI